MPLPTSQQIYAGAAELLVGTSPVAATAGTVTNINNAGTAYTKLSTDLIVDSASAIAPDVWETTSTLTLGDPPVIDVICSVATGELMWCWKRTNSTNTIYVIRGAGKYWTKYSYSNTDYSSAASVIDNAELELLGTFTMPTKASLVVTNGDVAVNVTQATFNTMDNYKGKDGSFTSEIANGELTCTLPRNTLPETMRTIGFQAITDGATPAEYYAEPGRAPAGTALPSKFFIVIPNDVLSSLPVINVGSANHLDFSRCILIPKGQISLAQALTMGNGSQQELAMTISFGFDEVMQKPCQQGITKEMARATEIIA
jgi:hypothetical protein